MCSPRQDLEAAKGRVTHRIRARGVCSREGMASRCRAGGDELDSYEAQYHTQAAVA